MTERKFLKRQGGILISFVFSWLFTLFSEAKGVPGTIFYSVDVKTEHINSTFLLGLDSIKKETKPHECTGQYFFVPGGYGLKKGQFYYQNSLVLINQFYVGLTDNLSIGAGVIPYIVPDYSIVPIWIHMNVSLPINHSKFVLGASAHLFKIGYKQIMNNFGLSFIETTYGTIQRNITLGIGLGYVDNRFLENPSYTVKSIYLMSNNYYFLSENYFKIDEYADVNNLSIIGFRKAWEKIDFDAGVILLYPVERMERGNGQYSTISYSPGVWLSLIIHR